MIFTPLKAKNTACKYTNKTVSSQYNKSKLASSLAEPIFVTYMRMCTEQRSSSQLPSSLPYFYGSLLRPIQPPVSKLSIYGSHLQQRGRWTRCTGYRTSLAGSGEGRRADGHGGKCNHFVSPFQHKTSNTYIHGPLNPR